MDSEDLIFFIDSCLEASMVDCSNYYAYPKDIWMMHAYGRWALKEIRKMLKEHPDVSPIWQLEIFKDVMDEYACKSVTPEANQMFSSAYDMTIYVLDWAIACERI